MPTPKKEESEEEYVERCIPIVLHEGTAKDGSQANAICHSMYQESKSKAFARFPNLLACKLEMKALGHKIVDVATICGEIFERAEHGALLKARQEGLTVLSKADETDIVLGGYASWECIDDDGDIFTVEAQSKALNRFLNQAPENQLITIDHGKGAAGEINIAKPILKHTDAKGKAYYTHVNEVGTYLITKLRNDDMVAVKHFREKARKGELNGYSVNAFALEKDIENPHRVLDMEYSAITITEKGVFKPRNPMTRNVQVLSKGESSKAKSDVDTESILQKYGFNKCCQG